MNTDSKTPTWDRLQTSFHAAIDPNHSVTLRRQDFDALRGEVNEVRKQQQREEALTFLKEAGATFGIAVAEPIVGAFHLMKKKTS